MNENEAAPGQGHGEDKDEFFGRMNAPTSGSMVSGPCGDVMEFYLYIKDDCIDDVKYYTTGCGNTRNSGRAAARRAKGKTIMQALAINPADIITSGECAPEQGRHCAILAVSALYRAIAEYLLLF
ncbi:MAG: iron-sulfur cluster assembly scaffold protein [Planctomycetes bacterium]|nr:iron-sulfur cluster assembly scaffold protein [Planctomycetota bacterium]